MLLPQLPVAHAWWILTNCTVLPVFCQLNLFVVVHKNVWNWNWDFKKNCVVVWSMNPSFVFDENGTTSVVQQVCKVYQINDLDLIKELLGEFWEKCVILNSKKECFILFSTFFIAMQLPIRFSVYNAVKNICWAIYMTK